MNQIHFLFGPDSGLWTMFMFLHFGLGVFFLGIGIWLYTNISLNKPFGLLTAILIIIVLGWVGLYFCARTYGERGNLKQEN